MQGGFTMGANYILHLNYLRKGLKWKARSVARTWNGKPGPRFFGRGYAQ
jgi:hypothetical protein